MIQGTWPPVQKDKRTETHRRMSSVIQGTWPPVQKDKRTETLFVRAHTAQGCHRAAFENARKRTHAEQRLGALDQPAVTVKEAEMAVDNMHGFGLDVRSDLGVQ